MEDADILFVPDLHGQPEGIGSSGRLSIGLMPKVDDSPRLGIFTVLGELKKKGVEKGGGGGQGTPVGVSKTKFLG